MCFSDKMGGRRGKMMCVCFGDNTLCAGGLVITYLTKILSFGENEVGIAKPPREGEGVRYCVLWLVTTPYVLVALSICIQQRYSHLEIKQYDKTIQGKGCGKKTIRGGVR